MATLAPKKLSVIIPAFNAAAFLPEALESIFAQNIQRLEVIVVDDGSTDGTPQVLNAYAGRVITHRQENSGGCSAPRNKGISLSSGEYIAIFDADDVVINNRMNRQIAFLDKYGDIDFLFTDYTNWDKARVWPRHTSSCPTFLKLRKRRIGVNEYLIRRNDAYETLFTENYILPSSIMFRRTLLNRVGIFDESLKSSEDIDFSFRVTAQHDIAYLDMVGLLRRVHPNSMSSATETVLRYKIISREKQIPVAKSQKAQRQLLRNLVSLHVSLASVLRHRGDYDPALGLCFKAVKHRALSLDPYREMAKIGVERIFRRLA